MEKKRREGEFIKKAKNTEKRGEKEGADERGCVYLFLRDDEER